MAASIRINQGLSARDKMTAIVLVNLISFSTVFADKITHHTNIGDIASTGFSGVIKPDKNEKLPSYDPEVDETFINPAGTSAKIITLREPKKVWQGQELILDASNPEKPQANFQRSISASQVGQVFGLAFDNAKYPNLYLTATSSYGLNIVKSDICEKDIRDKEGKTLCAFVNPEDVDTRPERMQKGGNHARWMKAQWGLGGGAGTIWRISGKTGKVSVFANITLSGKPNSGAALGNIAFDKNHHQIFVSDLDTGMIHRLNMKGKNLEVYDHGVTGRKALKLKEIKNNADDRISIISEKFDTNNPSTWGFSAPKRQVWGVAVHNNRLYYSVWNGEKESAEIWSVDIKAQGQLGNDIRLDITLPIKTAGEKNLAISDITFSKEGAMLLAERGNRLPSYDFKQFAEVSTAHVYRYWLERPNDEETLTQWVAQPEEYAVGFDKNQQNTSGGIALGYGFNSKGEMEFDRCDETLWSTGENLRVDNALAPELNKSGKQNLDGLQASSSRPVKSSNTPPWASYFIDHDTQYDDQAQQGHIGDVAVAKRPCPLCRALPQEPIPFGRKKDKSIIVLGDAVTTGFSGVVKPSKKEKLPSYNTEVDETFINTKGVSARILSVGEPKKVWQGQQLKPETVREITAAQVGQVFGITIDSSANIYLGATSLYGLNIVKSDICEKDIRDKKGRSLCVEVNKEDKDTRPERLQKGDKRASWMQGQWGNKGGPGSIWRINGRTGAVSLYANIKLNGNKNSGAGLGNLAYDAEHGQIFVSDLDTGMIHRLNSRAKDVEQYDHGTTGRESAKLVPVEFDKNNRISIKDKKFDTNDPATWAFAKAKRRVWGLAVHKSRLYYSVWNGAKENTEIWSINILKKGDKFKDVVQKVGGKLGEDIRKEIVLPLGDEKEGGSLPISDIAFTTQGAMILAQRGQRLPSYDFKQFAETGNARVYRYWLERPNDLETDSRWIAQPEEYAVGFAKTQRNSTGGIALGYGYNSKGEMELNRCDETLWTSGENLRASKNKDFTKALKKSGEINIEGLQASSSRPVKGSNTPPWASYFIDIDEEYKKPIVSGQIGDIEIYKRPCYVRYDCGKATPVIDVSGVIPGLPVIVPPVVTKKPPVLVPPPNPPEIPKPEFPDPEFEWCPNGICVLLICEPLNLWPWCEDDKKEACMSLKTTPAGPFYDSNINEWSFPLSVSSLTGDNIDTVKVTPVTPLVSLTNGSTYPVGVPNIKFTGVSVGQTAVFEVCGFDSAKAATGEPYNCCNTTFGIKIEEKPAEEIPHLDIRKEYSQTEEGKDIFTFLVDSIFEGKTSDDLSFTDTVPAGISLDSLDPANATNWSCPGLPVIGPATLKCTYIGPKPTPADWHERVIIYSSVQGNKEIENCVKVDLIDKGTGQTIPSEGRKEECIKVNKLILGAISNNKLKVVAQTGGAK